MFDDEDELKKKLDDMVAGRTYSADVVDDLDRPLDSSVPNAPLEKEKAKIIDESRKATKDVAQRQFAEKMLELKKEKTEVPKIEDLSTGKQATVFGKAVEKAKDTSKEIQPIKKATDVISTNNKKIIYNKLFEAKELGKDLKEFIKTLDLTAPGARQGLDEYLANTAKADQLETSLAKNIKDATPKTRNYNGMTSLLDDTANIAKGGKKIIAALPLVGAGMKALTAAGLASGQVQASDLLPGGGVGEIGQGSDLPQTENYEDMKKNSEYMNLRRQALEKLRNK